MLLSPHTLSVGRPDTPRDEKGFTLIELIVVTTLIAIMLSVSIPSLRDTFFTDPLKSTTRKIIGLVTGVRELAVRSQQPYLLHVSHIENRIWYEREVEEEKLDEDTLREQGVIFPESVRITGILVRGSESLLQDQLVVWISKKGLMNDTIIRIEDDNGDHLNIRFYPFLDPAIVSDQDAPF
ncbi:MAG: prepilin-type N-terminal cleavage/methylation domain-containing protein [Desulforhopalus sp.]